MEFFRFCDKIVSTHNQLCIIEVRDIINDDYYYDYYQSDDDYEEQTKTSNSNDLEKDYPTKISGKNKKQKATLDSSGDTFLSAMSLPPHFLSFFLALRQNLDKNQNLDK